MSALAAFRPAAVGVIEPTRDSVLVETVKAVEDLLGN